MIQLTDNAVAKVKTLLAADDKQGYALRVAVQGGGCSGFQYGLTFENEQKDTDTVCEFDGLKVFIDPASQPFLKDVTVDYVESLQGSGFKIENPNSQGSCGCGHSFTV